MKWDVLNIQGQKTKEIELPEAIFGLELKNHLLHTVVKGYQANRRQGTHATKTRSMVSGGGKKPFKQKGTGGARQGSSRSPLMPGGATCHGPQPRDYTQKMNKKARQEALRVALSDKVKHQSLVILSDFELQKYSTKQILATLKNINKTAAKTALLADERKDDFLYKSSRNIHGVQSTAANEINAENVLRHSLLVLTESALQAITQRALKTAKVG